MANLDFYAAPGDQRELLSFVLGLADVVVYELSSEYDSELRTFPTVAEIEAAFEIGGNRTIHLQIYSKDVMSEPDVRRIELIKVPGHDFRYAVEGVGLMQLYLGDIKQNLLHHSHFGHWNEAGARRRAIEGFDSCDWTALRRISGKIQRYIRKMAVAKLFDRPILGEAYRALDQDLSIEYGAEVHDKESKEIEANAA